MVPKWAQANLNRADEEIILASLAAAQNKSGVTIVPVVLKKVSRNRGMLIGILTGIFGFIVVCVDPESLFPSANEWHRHLNPLIYIGALFLSIYLSKFPFVGRFFIPVKWIDEVVYRRSLLEFYNLGLSSTSARKGILLLVSLEDRRAVIIADKGLTPFLSLEATDKMCHKIASALTDGQLGLGFSEVIREAGSTVAEVSPSIQAAVSTLELDGVIFKID